MYSSHSSTPSIESVCAIQDVIARRERVDVTMTLPEPSAEYIRSLSSDQAIALTGDICKRRRCKGVGSGREAVAEAEPDIVFVLNVNRKIPWISGVKQPF